MRLDASAPVQPCKRGITGDDDSESAYMKADGIVTVQTSM
jgi:hypothetical protein